MSDTVIAKQSISQDTNEVAAVRLFKHSSYDCLVCVIGFKERYHLKRKA